MRFLFARCANLPGLAWGAVIEKGRVDATVYHGEQVEVREDGFFEGAWDGPVDLSSALAATVVCGTGGRCGDAGLNFWAGTDNLYPLYSIAAKESLFISNSPVFVQVLASETPDLCYPFYHDDFVRMVRTGFNVRGALRTASGNRMRLYFGQIVTVDRALNVSFSRHRICAPFSDYESYYSVLADSVEQVLLNASTDRRFPYEPLASCSAGYDANACAALAARAGCREAITFTSSGATEENSDSGETVAAELGLSCVTGDNSAYLSRGDLSEFCIVPHSMYPAYLVFESTLFGRILTVGSGGGNIWSKGNARVIDDNCFSWARFLSGYGLLEFRLRARFLVFAVPRIGSRHNRALHRITCSTEMQPWSRGGKYDKPIPRRILEEAGVDPQAFGVRKMGTSQVRLDTAVVQGGPTGRAYREFLQYRARVVSPVVDRYWRFRHRWRLFILCNFSSPEKRRTPYTFLRRKFSFLNSRPNFFEWKYLFAHQFSFHALKDRYRVRETSQMVAGRAENRSRRARQLKYDETVV